MSPWRPIDAIGRWVRDHFDAQAQMRLGVLCILVGVALGVFGFWSSEPFLVYQMSAAALWTGGITIIVGAQIMRQGEDSASDS